MSLTLSKHRLAAPAVKLKYEVRKHKKLAICLSVVVLLVILRAVGVVILHKKINQYLAEFSPTYSFHIEDLDLSFLRMAYRFEGIEGKLKSNDRKFLEAESVDVSLAWREIIKGRILTDITVTELNFTYLKELTQSAQKRDKTDARDAKETLFPVHVEKLDLVDSKIVLEEYPGLNPDSRLTATGINGRVTNLTPTAKNPFSFYNLDATLLGGPLFKATGHFNMVKEKTDWDFNAEVRDFDLTLANKFFKRKLPLTFTKGRLDLYTEAISKDGKILGYVKPFFHRLDIISSKEKWEFPKQTINEIGVALANLILRTGESKTVATIVPFKYDKEFEVDTKEAVEKVIENGFKQQLTPGLDNKYDLINDG